MPPLNHLILMLFCVLRVQLALMTSKKRVLSEIFRCIHPNQFRQGIVNYSTKFTSPASNASDLADNIEYNAVECQHLDKQVPEKVTSIF